jgi:uncharacterized protein YukE
MEVLVENIENLRNEFLNSYSLRAVHEKFLARDEEMEEVKSADISNLISAYQELSAVLHALPKEKEPSSVKEYDDVSKQWLQMKKEIDELYQRVNTDLGIQIDTKEIDTAEIRVQEKKKIRETLKQELQALRSSKKLIVRDIPYNNLV